METIKGWITIITQNELNLKTKTRQWKKEFVFGSLERDCSQLINLLAIEKSPRKKLINLGRIFDSIRFLLKFNGKDADVGVDDQIPILNYALIKAQTLRMNSNVRFMELYIGEGERKREGAQLTQIKGICKLIPILIWLMFLRKNL